MRKKSIPILLLTFTICSGVISYQNVQASTSFSLGHSIENFIKKALEANHTKKAKEQENAQLANQTIANTEKETSHTKKEITNTKKTTASTKKEITNAKKTTVNTGKTTTNTEKETPNTGKTTTNTTKKKTVDYTKYSNKTQAWYFMRNKEHNPVNGAQNAEALAKYNAYYLNVNVEKGDQVIYLTFDCGYENGYTEKILDILKAHSAKAMFFVTKPYIKGNPELVKRMKEEGHLVGNHTCTHPSLPSKSIDQVKAEITDCADYMKEQTGYDMDLFLRPPMGEYSNRTLKIAKDLGYKTIFWSIAYLDYDINKQPGKDYVINHFKDNYHNGAIPLIHNVSSSNTEALDEVLTFLEKKKFRFGSLEEL